MMILLMIIALPLITLLYGAKWETSAPYFQILCISGLIYTINTLNTNVIKALGKGKIYFAVQIIKRTIGIALIFFGMRYGIYGLLWAVASVSYISFIINALVSKRLINYGIFRQLWDVFPCLLAAATAGVLAYLLGRVLPLNMYVVMLIQIVVYAVLYLLLAKLLKIEGLQTYTDILTNLLHRKN
jgi:O-antigen/teichoic acid export membrane protein